MRTANIVSRRFPICIIYIYNSFFFKTPFCLLGSLQPFTVIISSLLALNNDNNSLTYMYAQPKYITAIDIFLELTDVSSFRYCSLLLRLNKKGRIWRILNEEEKRRG